jgi:hypothetical protein
MVRLQALHKPANTPSGLYLNKESGNLIKLIYFEAMNFNENLSFEAIRKG